MNCHEATEWYCALTVLGVVLDMGGDNADCDSAVRFLHDKKFDTTLLGLLVLHSVASTTLL